MCVCVCPCDAHVWVSVLASVWGPDTNLKCHFSAALCCVWRQELSLMWKSLSGLLGEPANPRGLPVSLPGPGITSAHHMSNFFVGLGLELRFLSMHDKNLDKWPFSPLSVFTHSGSIVHRMSLGCVFFFPQFALKTLSQTCRELFILADWFYIQPNWQQWLITTHILYTEIPVYSKT